MTQDDTKRLDLGAIYIDSYQYSHMSDPNVTFNWLNYATDHWSGDDECHQVITQQDAIELIEFLRNVFKLEEES